MAMSTRSMVWTRRLASAEHPEIRRMIALRNACSPADVSFPAAALRDSTVARWLRRHRLAVDVRTPAELHSAISAGIHPASMTVHADQLDRGGIRRAGATGVGRVVLNRSDQLRPLHAEDPQNVLWHMADAAISYSEHALDAVISCPSTTLIGLACHIGVATDGALAYPTAITNTIAAMDYIRYRHGVLLTRLVLEVADTVAVEESSRVHRALSEAIGDAVDDACASLRFPRPAIVMAA